MFHLLLHNMSKFGVNSKDRIVIKKRSRAGSKMNHDPVILHVVHVHHLSTVRSNVPFEINHIISMRRESTLWTKYALRHFFVPPSRRLEGIPWRAESVPH